MKRKYNKGVKEPPPETIHVKAPDRKPKRSKEEILVGIEHRDTLINYMNKLFYTLRVANCDETGFNILKRKPELSVFINNPEVAIDNNRAE